MIKKITISALLIVFSFFFIAAHSSAAKPKVSSLGALAQDGKNGVKKIRVWFEVSSNTNSIRVVYCPRGVSKKSIKCKGRSRIFVPKKSECKPGVPRCNWWGSQFKTKSKSLSGYVVLKNSDGVTKKTWTAYSY